MYKGNSRVRPQTQLTWGDFFDRLKQLDESALFTQERLAQFMRDSKFLHQEDGRMVFFVDFCEIFRLMHANLDVLLRGGQFDRLRFAIEHLALNYTFQTPTKGIDLVLCTAYYEEFKLHFARITDELIGLRRFALSLSQDKKAYLDAIDVDEQMVDRMQELSRLMKEHEDGKLLLERFDKFYMDLGIESQRRRYIERGLEQFGKLLQERKLHLTIEYEEIGNPGPSTYTAAKKTPFFVWAFESLCGISAEMSGGQRRELANTYDAWGLNQIYEANKSIAERGGSTKAVLFSNSYKLKSFLYRAHDYWTAHDRKSELDSRHLPEIRDVYYMILRLYADTKGTEEALREFSILHKSLTAVRDRIRECCSQQTKVYFNSVVGQPVPRKVLARLRLAVRSLQRFEDFNLFRRLAVGDDVSVGSSGFTSRSEMIEGVITSILGVNEQSQHVIDSLRSGDPRGNKYVIEAVNMLRHKPLEFKEGIDRALSSLSVDLESRSLLDSLDTLYAAIKDQSQKSDSE